MTHGTVQDRRRRTWAAPGRTWLRPAGRLGLVAVSAWTVGCVALTAVAPLLGWSSSVVVSGSMAPALDPGDVVLAAPRGPDTLRPGDVVVMSTGGTDERLTHRLVELSPDGTWVTRGDASGVPDSAPLSASDVRGVVVLVVPAVGLPAVWARDAARSLATDS